MDALTLFLIVGATARVTRFVNLDVLAARLRIFVMNRWEDDSLPAYVVTCVYCMSIYVGALVVGVGALLDYAGVWQVGAAALTASYLTAFLRVRFDV